MGPFTNGFGFSALTSEYFIFWKSLTDNLRDLRHLRIGLLGSLCGIKEALVFLLGIAVGHPRNIVADHAM